MRNLTCMQITNAHTISDVTRIARGRRTLVIQGIACGYRFTRATATEDTFTESERAWFKRPVGGAL